MKSPSSQVMIPACVRTGGPFPSPKRSSLSWGRSDRVPALGASFPSSGPYAGGGRRGSETSTWSTPRPPTPLLRLTLPRGCPEPISQAQNKCLLRDCRRLPCLNSKPLPAFFFMKRFPQHSSQLLYGLSHLAFGVRTLQALWAFHSLFPEDYLGRELSLTDPWPGSLVVLHHVLSGRNPGQWGWLGQPLPST